MPPFAVTSRSTYNPLTFLEPPRISQEHAMGESSLGLPPSETTSEPRLDSWKEIAAYLGRDVTTVQRWEKRETMPVHRHVHDKRGSVSALAPELEAWLKSRRQQLADDQDDKKEDREKEQKTEAPVEAEAGHGRRAT